MLYGGGRALPLVFAHRYSDRVVTLVGLSFMRCTRLGLVKYDTDLMSVAFHLSDVYHEQYESVHRGYAVVVPKVSVQRVIGQHFRDIGRCCGRMYIEIPRSKRRGTTFNQTMAI